MSTAEPHWISVLGKRSVCVGSGILDTAVLADDLRSVAPPNGPHRKIVIVTDRTVAACGALDRLRSCLTVAGYPDESVVVHTLSVAGELGKTRAEKERCEDRMLEARCDRSTVVVSLGGGVVTDLAGFIAATFMRGVPVIHVPTSLLAMVDAAVGGKTGLNPPHGKNLIGAFWQPLRVYCDVTVLQTLPQRHLCNGMAEVIKVFAVWDSAAFDQLEQKEYSVSDGIDSALLLECVARSVAIKADIVTRDEREGGLRALLNFGHTIGHAVEALRWDSLLHGECVAIGCVAEAELARALGHIGTHEVSRVQSLLARWQLPTAIPDDLHIDDLMDRMALDKKARGGKKRVVLLNGIGSTTCHDAEPVDDRLIRRVCGSCATVAVPTSASSVFDRPATVRVPGSKSISNRVLLLAALGRGECRLHGLLHSDDTKVMIEALRRLGAATFARELDADDGHSVLVVRPRPDDQPLLRQPTTDAPIHLGNAGTAMRFLTTAVTLMQPGDEVVLTGIARMCQRPIRDLVDALREHGVDIAYCGSNPDNGCPPLRVRGCGGLRGGRIELAADVSSQYVSSVLLSAAMSRAEAGPVELALRSDRAVVSQPYIDMTLQVMQRFGITVERPGTNRYVVQPGRHTNPARVDVEADASSATYPLCIAASLSLAVGRPITVTVPAVGTDSLQGDAQFHTVLERMGCTVEQTVGETRCTGNPAGLKAVDLDMGDMTDSFMGVACLAALAEGTTRLRGIANQRVKECDRLAAMVEELGKVGVRAAELEDGIEIHGSRRADMHGAVIDPRDDHRIAMSFAVLGCAVPDLMVTDKRCTGKTYPEFWDDLERRLDLQVSGMLGADVSSAAATAASAAGSAVPSVWIVGMRASGKTSCGRQLAETLGWRFVDLDAELERELGQSLKTFIPEHGWAEFRRRELEVARRAVALDDRTVVSTGGGLVETPAARALLQSLPVVLHLHRHVDDVCEALGVDESRPAYADGQHPRDVAARRLPLYRQCSTHEVFLAAGETQWPRVVAEMSELVARLVSSDGQGEHLRPAQRLAREVSDSFFVSLTYPDMADAIGELPTVTEGAAAVELRADLLREELQTEDGVRAQIAVLRRHLPPQCRRIVFTVRTKQQGGSFPDDEERCFALLAAAVRAGVEFVDMEACYSAEAQRRLIDQASRCGCSVVASWHDYTADPDVAALVGACVRDGVDIVKIVLKASAATDACDLRQELRRLLPAGTLSIAVLTGEQGRLSRVINPFFTPVTHDSLPIKAAPGQLSLRQICELRTALGMVERRQLWLFGTPIEKSPSPAMHNAAFECVGLPHRYGRCDTSDVERVRELVSAADFGGASVTIPLKQAVVPLCDELTATARAIGAVNCLVPHKGDNGGRRLIGDNTDWLGVVGALTAALGGAPPRPWRQCAAVVLGAGGTARAAVYALGRMGLGEVWVWNRTEERARALVADLQIGTVLPSGGGGSDRVGGDERPGKLPIGCVVGTVPGSVQTESPAFQSLPAWLFADGAATAVLDASYVPAETPVVVQARAAGCAVALGRSMLAHQAFPAWEQWAGGLSAPRAVMEVARDSE